MTVHFNLFQSTDNFITLNYQEYSFSYEKCSFCKKSIFSQDRSKTYSAYTFTDFDKLSNDTYIYSASALGTCSNRWLKKFIEVFSNKMITHINISMLQSLVLTVSNQMFLNFSNIYYSSHVIIIRSFTLINDLVQKYSHLEI